MLYKLTAPDGAPVHGGVGVWPLPADGKPGDWRNVTGKIVTCERGLHLLRREDIREWVRGGVLWEAEPAPRTQTVVDTNKVVVRKARLVRQVAVIDRPLLIEWAADCAEHVLYLFEAKYPKDDRPRKAIETARRYARGEATREEARDATTAAATAAYYAATTTAASYAATTTSYAATAAYYASYAATAAYYASYAATTTYYASYAAYAAAATAAAATAAAATAAAASAATTAAATTASFERQWQTGRLMERLGL
jgi:hypothetical protein